jgi:hypothetical protein
VSIAENVLPTANMRSRRERPVLAVRLLVYFDFINVVAQVPGMYRPPTLYPLINERHVNHFAHTKISPLISMENH